MTDKRTTSEIEKDIARDRASLKDTMAQMRAATGPSAVMRDISDRVKEDGYVYGKDALDSVTDMARRNPLALGLVGAGVAWLVMGQGPSADRINGAARHAVGRDAEGYAKRREKAYSKQGDARIYARGPVPQGEGPAWLDENSGPSWSQKLRLQLRKAQYKTGKTGSSEEGLSVAQRLREKYHDVASELSEGTESLSEEARARVVAARIRAVEMQDRSRRAAREGGRAANRFFNEHPLAVGVMAFAAGSIIAGCLPRTRMEDERLGSHSDALYDEAERIFQEEKDRLGEVARTTGEAAYDEWDNLRKDAREGARQVLDDENTSHSTSGTGEAVVDRVEASLDRVAQKAKDAARDEDLGQKDLGESDRKS